MLLVMRRAIMQLHVLIGGNIKSILLFTDGFLLQKKYSHYQFLLDSFFSFYFEIIQSVPICPSTLSLDVPSVCILKYPKQPFVLQAGSTSRSLTLIIFFSAPSPHTTLLMQFSWHLFHMPFNYSLIYTTFCSLNLKLFRERTNILRNN